MHTYHTRYGYRIERDADYTQAVRLDGQIRWARLRLPVKTVSRVETVDGIDRIVIRLNMHYTDFGWVMPCRLGLRQLSVAASDVYRSVFHLTPYRL